MIFYVHFLFTLLCIFILYLSFSTIIPANQNKSPNLPYKVGEENQTSPLDL